jgi:hypothetical protein
MNAKHGSRWARDQHPACGDQLIWTAIVAASLWYHLTHTAGADGQEFVFLIVMLATLALTSVLYALRLRWSYAAGVLACLGFYAALGKALLDDTFFFTLSLYNVLVLLVIALSIRLMRSQPPGRWWDATVIPAGCVRSDPNVTLPLDTNLEPRSPSTQSLVPATLVSR